MDEVMAGSVSPVHLAAFLTALRAKGETLAEVQGLAASVLKHAVPIHIEAQGVDVVGTGGDRHHTVNISTMASIVVAGTGTTVIRHGNRAASSKSGGADVLEALGVRLDLTPERLAELANNVGITFLFAQAFHPAFRHAGPVRRELGFPTVFNVLGPLNNPARPRATALGAADAHLAPLIAGVFAERGDRALVFRSDDGLDELSTTAAADVWVVQDGSSVHHRLDAVAELGLAPSSLADLRGGDATENADVLRRVVAGETGPVRDVVLLNAAAALVADGRLPGTGEGPLTERFKAALVLATASIDDGAASDLLDAWVSASNA